MEPFAQFPYAPLGAMFTGLGYLIGQVASFRKNSQPCMTQSEVKELLVVQKKEILADVRQILTDKGV